MRGSLLAALRADSEKERGSLSLEPFAGPFAIGTWSLDVVFGMVVAARNV